MGPKRKERKRRRKAQRPEIEKQTSMLEVPYSEHVLNWRLRGLKGNPRNGATHVWVLASTYYHMLVSDPHVRG